jgi:hypothetical protein
MICDYHYLIKKETKPSLNKGGFHPPNILDVLQQFCFKNTYTTPKGECKESRNAYKLLRVESTQLEFDKEDIEEKSTMNPLYKYDIENELQQNIHDIKKQNSVLNK